MPDPQEVTPTMDRKHWKPSPAMVIATVALFVALGGGAYASVAINQVRSQHIKNGEVKTPDLAGGAVTNAKLRNNAVNSAKVADGSLGVADLSAAAQASLRGSTGPQGPAGAAGPGARWILVSGAGTKIAGTDGVNVVSRPFTGEFIVDFGVPTSGKLLLATPSERDNASTPKAVEAAPCGLPSGATSDTYANCASMPVNYASVAVTKADDNTPANYSFYLALIS